ncbi:MAG: primosomal protein N', partial [FCB group bacterium]|nr:primosomal protein N' [FCB group bacterium]
DKTIEPFYSPGKRIMPAIIDNIKKLENILFYQLLKEGIIIEKWNADDVVKGKKNIVGFKVSNYEEWSHYFPTKKFQPQPFDNIKSRAELETLGWSNYQIKKAVENSIIEPVYAESDIPILDFIIPRENLLDIKLNQQQQQVFHNIKKKLTEGFKTFLLHGVTGSGKTIIYCHLSREIIKAHKTVLMLTPEIALTSAVLAYFRGFFGNQVTIIHSAMSPKERMESWRGILRGKYSIVVGPRSAIFAPLSNLGLIIVDEEHDSSYKQTDPAPRFHGRDAAIMRAKLNNIPVLLGSATPSLESYHNASLQKYELWELTQRPGQAKLPVVRIVDMKKERLQGDLPYISYTLKKEVDTRLEKKEQVILYLNRRGHSPQLKCNDCGYVPHCPNCQVKLTYHKTGKKLSCHYCGYVLNNYDTCPQCQSHRFLYLGVGTQKVEENIPRLFKGAKAIRLDSDSATGREKAYQILKDFSRHKYNLLLGTQMVTKGLDLPEVTLVGVLSADMSLDMPDFRSSEKTFARLLQVAGRSGRFQTPGEVIIQTFYPNHEVIHDAARQDYQSFYEREIISRKNLWYPPFSRLIKIVLSSADEKKLEPEALKFRQRLDNKLHNLSIKTEILGPAPCPLYYLRKKYRRHLFIKTRQIIKLVRLLTEWEINEPHFKLPSSIKLTVDIDPDDMM